MGKADPSLQREAARRERLARLLDALPVFAGYVTPDGALDTDFDRPIDPLRIARAGSAEWLWDIPAFAGLPGVSAQLGALCARAMAGEAVQVERPYLAGSGGARLRRRGLLSVTPYRDEDGFVTELGVTLVDCDAHGLPPRSLYAPARLDRANRRLDNGLALAQATIAASQDTSRDRLAARLQVIAATADALSRIDQQTVPLRDVAAIGLGALQLETARKAHHTVEIGDGDVSLSALPSLALLIYELGRNALDHGSWRDAAMPGQITLSWTQDHDRAVLQWAEQDRHGAPRPKCQGFGIKLAHEILPESCGAVALLEVASTGYIWTFDVPTMQVDNDTDSEDFARFDGGYIGAFDRSERAS